MESIHRVTFFLTEEARKTDPPVNLFVFAKDNHDAILKATPLFQEEMKKRTNHERTFRAEAYPSSEKEMLEFIGAVKAGFRTQEVMN